jgi:16S rRNA (guanine1207-N2)-methyltransferase
MPLIETAVYGDPPEALAERPRGATFIDPRRPGSGDLEALADRSVGAMIMEAPGGTLERRALIAHALRTLVDDGELVVLAHGARGGRRLRAELAAFGCAAHEETRRHFRICSTRRPDQLVGVDEAISGGAPQKIDLDMWSQPGLFSWSQLDPGSALLIGMMPPLCGRGADFGAGIGWLAKAALRSDAIDEMTLVELDARAVRLARRNIADPRARFLHADATSPEHGLSQLDFIVMNPPFHSGGMEERALGTAFIRAAARALRSGGSLWLTANRHLPYEEELSQRFSRWTQRADQAGYKVIEAVR